MPRQPKDFQIAWSSIEKLDPSGYLRTGPDSVVPSRFKAVITMAVPQLLVTMEVAVGHDLRPRVIELSLRANTTTPVTTTVLRQVLIDQLLREAMSKAIIPASEAPEPDPRALGLADEPLTFSAQERAQANADEDARHAARIYSEAVTSGSGAPAVAVANAMNRSRSQAARYIRRARELGLLPALGSSEAVME